MAVTKLTGGKLLEKRLAELAQRISKSGTLSVGFLENAKYPDGTSIAMVAAINEFGRLSRKQPPRPFFRRMIADKSSKWGDALGALLVQTDYDATKALGQAGKGIEGQLVQSIKDFTDPPLSPITIARKGFDKPLIDTGTMWRSVDSEVK